MMYKCLFLSEAREKPIHVLTLYVSLAKMSTLDPAEGWRSETENKLPNYWKCQDSTSTEI